MIQLPFEDRAGAGRLLAAELKLRDLPRNTIILALRRGGVPVGFEIARAFNAPLDVLVVRKLGVPWQPELAMGAIAGGSVVLDRRLIRELGISQAEIDSIVARERTEAERRERLYRAGRSAPSLRGRTVVLVDDGLATGSTMVAAARYVRNSQPGRLVVAVPVGSSQACRLLKPECDECVCLATPEPFWAVGQWYLDFQQTRDEEVQDLLERNQGAVAEERELTRKG